MKQYLTCPICDGILSAGICEFRFNPPNQHCLSHFLQDRDSHIIRFSDLYIWVFYSWNTTYIKNYYDAEPVLKLNCIIPIEPISSLEKRIKLLLVFS
jgi:hypothetical protein